MAGRALGFRVIEFMNTGDSVTPQQWRTWRQLATANDMRMIFEFHPAHNWDSSQPERPSSAQDILQAATPFLEDGAFAVMIDHDAFDLVGDGASQLVNTVIDEFGLEMLVFEVASPKDGRDKWHQHLTDYFRLCGPDCNVSNIMPSQALFVEPMRMAAQDSTG